MFKPRPPSASSQGKRISLNPKIRSLPTTKSMNTKLEKAKEDYSLLSPSKEISIKHRRDKFDIAASFRNERDGISPKRKDIQQNVFIGKEVFLEQSKLKGIIRYYGEVQFAEGVWCGLELDEPRGKNNGTVQDIAYFSCEKNYGLFVRQNVITVLETESVSEEMKPKKVELSSSEGVTKLEEKGEIQKRKEPIKNKEIISDHTANIELSINENELISEHILTCNSKQSHLSTECKSHLSLKKKSSTTPTSPTKQKLNEIISSMTNFSPSSKLQKGSIRAITAISSGSALPNKANGIQSLDKRSGGNMSGTDINNDGRRPSISQRMVKVLHDNNCLAEDQKFLALSSTTNESPSDQISTAITENAVDKDSRNEKKICNSQSNSQSCLLPPFPPQVKMDFNSRESFEILPEAGTEEIRGTPVKDHIARRFYANIHQESSSQGQKGYTPEDGNKCTRKVPLECSPFTSMMKDQLAEEKWLCDMLVDLVLTNDNLKEKLTEKIKEDLQLDKMVNDIMSEKMETAIKKEVQVMLQEELKQKLSVENFQSETKEHSPSPSRISSSGLLVDTSEKERERRSGAANSPKTKVLFENREEIKVVAKTENEKELGLEKERDEQGVNNDLFLKLDSFQVFLTEQMTQMENNFSSYDLNSSNQKKLPPLFESDNLKETVESYRKKLELVKLCTEQMNFHLMNAIKQQDVIDAHETKTIKEDTTHEQRKKEKIKKQTTLLEKYQAYRKRQQQKKIERKLQRDKFREEKEKKKCQNEESIFVEC